MTTLTAKEAAKISEFSNGLNLGNNLEVVMHKIWLAATIGNFSEVIYEGFMTEYVIEQLVQKGYVIEKRDEDVYFKVSW